MELLLEPLINKVVEDKNKNNPPRSYLGASMLGSPCLRKLWLYFRWIEPEKFDGRLLRLFDVGHREELVIAEQLRSIGIDLRYTGDEQATIAITPHITGHPDGIIYGGIPEWNEYPCIWENKTSNKNNFEKMLISGIQIVKPQHYTQIQVEMFVTGIKWTLYSVLCKDDSRLYFEMVPINEEFARSEIEKAKSVILAQNLPDPISSSISSPDCEYCPYSAFCYVTGETTNFTCRNCVHALAEENGSWLCRKFKKVIPFELQLKGCDYHVVLPSVVPWEVVNSIDDSITYRWNKKDVINGVINNQLYTRSKDMEEAFHESNTERLSAESNNVSF